MKDDEILIDCYEGSFGQTIVIICHRFIDLDLIKSLFRKVQADNSKPLRLDEELLNIRLVNLDGLFLSLLSTEHESKDNSIELVREFGKNFFYWSRTRQGWQNSIEKMEDLLSSIKDGDHRFFIDENGSEDYLLEIMYKSA